MQYKGRIVTVCINYYQRNSRIARLSPGINCYFSLYPEKIIENNFVWAFSWDIELDYSFIAVCP